MIDVTDECIHGFPTELCDICSPRSAPEPAQKASPAPRRSRATSTLREPRTPAPRGRTAAAGTSASAATKGLALSSLRAHHFTHIENLPAIVAAGALLPRSEATPSIDVSSGELTAARSAVLTPEGIPLPEYVPFSLTPDSLAWEAVRSGADSPLWSDAARTSRATDFVVLVVPATAFGDAVSLADSNAIDADVRFATGREAVGALLRRVQLSDPDLQRVELLAAESVPLDSVAVVGVANDRSRERVRAILAEGAGPAPRVAVFPPWFVSGGAV